MEEPIAKGRLRAYKTEYDPEPLVARVMQLLEEKNESYREASLDSGLDHQAVRRILGGRRPQMHICIQFADHFGVNPNEFLELAGWPRLKAFDIPTSGAQNLPAEAVDVAMQLSKISNPAKRKQVAQAMTLLIKEYFDV